MESRKGYRDIHISVCLNGFVVSIGHQTLVYTDPSKLASDFADYMAHPEETEIVFTTRSMKRAPALGGALAPIRDYERSTKVAEPERINRC